MVVGDFIINPKLQRHYKFEVYGHDDNLRQSFSVGGSVTRITEACLNKIEKHSHVIYISGKTGSLAEAHQLALAGAEILKAGGIGVRIDTAGKAFEKSKWLQYLKSFEETDLFEMFVLSSIVHKDGTVFSCGMHNLGLKDTIVSGKDFQASVDLISIFGYYQIFDKPVILRNQTFQPNLQSPKYVITEELKQPYKGSVLYGNPFGMWRLTKI